MKVKTLMISSVLCLVLGAWYWGCVELPSSAPPFTPAIAQFRFMYADPALITLLVSMADGPNFTAYTDLPADSFGKASTYSQFFAGSKKLFLKSGGVPVDPETSVISFDPDQRGTVLVVPRDPVTQVRFLKLSERSVNATPGQADSARVRFVNCVASRDTIDVRRDSSSRLSLSNPAVNDLRFGRVSSFLKIPKDSTMRFWVTQYNSTVAPGADTITIVGASNKEYTVVAFDSLSRARFVRFDDD